MNPIRVNLSRKYKYKTVTEFFDVYKNYDYFSVCRYTYHNWQLCRIDFMAYDIKDIIL